MIPNPVSFHPNRSKFGHLAMCYLLTNDDKSHSPFPITPFDSSVPMLMSRRSVLFSLLALPGIDHFPARAESAACHGIAMHGKPQWPENFTHPTYANPTAPQ